MHRYYARYSHRTKTEYHAVFYHTSGPACTFFCLRPPARTILHNPSRNVFQGSQTRLCVMFSLYMPSEFLVVLCFSPQYHLFLKNFVVFFFFLEQRKAYYQAMQRRQVVQALKSLDFPEGFWQSIFNMLVGGRGFRVLDQFMHIL